VNPVRIEQVNIILPIAHSENRDSWKKQAAKTLAIDVSQIQDVRLLKHSIDARQREIKAQLRIEISIGGPLPETPPLVPTYLAVPQDAGRIIIVGSGPAGIFAALRAIELGKKPIVLERGKNVFDRRYDLPKATRMGIIEEDSNYCFGEGGAGTFSDGKLYTRATKRGPVSKIYEVLVAHGAPERILIDAHPHIGSNLLPKVVMNLRKTIVEAGGEVHFSAKVNDLLLKDGKILGVTTVEGREFLGDAVILATGHSARDIYELLNAKNIRLDQKAFAVGVRIEHPQPLIDSLQYHYPLGQKRHELLPAAKYSLATKIDDRGVHSFCMCPGGFIVPASTKNDQVVVNGMSLARRDSPFANSGMVVTVEPEDTLSFKKEHGVLSGMAFQNSLEVLAKQAGGGGQVAPAQRLPDFMKGRDSVELNATSYIPGLKSARLDELLPRWIVDRMKIGFAQFGRSMPGYITSLANMVGFETRTSSPVRIPRDEQTLQHPEVQGLYPCGEGAGFAGGIASAAIDGMRCAEAACTR
jgi:uncharacterized FAD-dependent dehydrogenase